MHEPDWLGALHDRQAPPLVMGILNVTPDSFSDGGRHSALEDARAHAQRMVEEGARIIDVGGESTRPGSAAVSDEEQCRRVLPVIAALRDDLPPEVVLSIDTRSPSVARAALGVGAALINDIAGGRDPALLAVAAELDAAVILMHMQGEPGTMQLSPRYDDVVEDVLRYLIDSAAAAQAAGVARERILIDPGIGFGKTREHNLRLLAGLARFEESGYPVLLGTSRKRFMGAICRETAFDELVGATCATTALGVVAGVRVFRVHDVRPNRQALEVAWAIGRMA